MLAVLVACADVPTGAPAVAAPKEERGRELASATIVAVGDLMMHGQVRATAEAHGWPTVWAGVTPLFEAADLAFLNLESPVAPDHRRVVKQMVFDSDPEVLDALWASGVDLLSFANNHVYDQGRAGFLETVERLERHPIEFLGAGRTCAEARKARILDANGIRIAFVGATDHYNDDLNAGEDEPCAATLSPRAEVTLGGANEAWVLEEARAARAAGAELVVLSVHWGLEYKTSPEAGVVAAARRLVDGGVDVVLGHHPHVAQPVEVRETPDGRLAVVVYSLGNFVSGQAPRYVPGVHAPAGGNPRDGLLVSFRAVRRDYGRAEGGGRLVRTEVADLEVVPLFTANDGGKITVAPTEARIAALTDALSGDVDDATAVRLARELKGMVERWAQVRSIVGEELVAPMP